MISPKQVSWTRFTMLVTVLAATGFVTPLALGQPEEPAGPANEIALLVEGHVDLLGGNTLVVFPFPYADGIKSIEGALIAERVVTRLTEGGQVRVVERAMIDKIMEEQKLSAAGFVDPSTAVEVGRLLGARGILSGTITDLGDVIEIHARLLNVETGEVVGTLKRRARKTIKTFISPLWSEIERIKTESPSFDLKVWADRGRASTEVPGYRIGDFITLYFKADRDCYVTIFDFTTSGSIQTCSFQLLHARQPHQSWTHIQVSRRPGGFQDSRQRPSRHRTRESLCHHERHSAFRGGLLTGKLPLNRRRHLQRDAGPSGRD